MVIGLFERNINFTLAVIFVSFGIILLRVFKIMVTKKVTEETKWQH